MGIFWRPDLVSLVFLSSLLFLTDQTFAIPYDPVECDAMELKKVGCFADNQQVPRPLPKLLFTDINETSPLYSGIRMNEPDPDSYMIDLICRCAQEALYRGYNMFGLQHYGECWSGKNAVTFSKYQRDGPSTHCITWKGKPCQYGLDCIGEDNTNFVYKAKDKPLPTASITSTARSTGSPTKPSPKPTKKATRPTAKNVPPTTPSKAVVSSPKSTASPTTPSSRPTKKATKPTKSVPSPTPSGSGTSTAKSTGSPTQPPSTPSLRPSTTKKTKPTKSNPSPTPPGTGTSTAKSTGSPIQPSLRPSNISPGTFSHPNPPCAGANCQQIQGQCSELPCYPASNIPYQAPSYQVPQAVPYPTCPVFGCPSTCYPACSFACCRSKLPKKTKLTKMHHKRTVFPDLDEA